MSDDDLGYDDCAVSADDVIGRHMRLSLRIDWVLAALKQAQIPFSSFTAEALNEVAATIEVRVSEAHGVGED